MRAAVSSLSAVALGYAADLQARIHAVVVVVAAALDIIAGWWKLRHDTRQKARSFGSLRRANRKTHRGLWKHLGGCRDGAFVCGWRGGKVCRRALCRHCGKVIRWVWCLGRRIACVRRCL